MNVLSIPDQETAGKRITVIRKLRAKVCLEFDDESSLLVPCSLFELLELKEGDSFAYSRISSIQKMAVALCFAKCCRSLSMRWKTTDELSDSLEKAAWPEAIIREVMDLLKESGYLDDRRYAGAYTARRRAQGYGDRRIRSELLQKGIPAQYADEALQSDKSSTHESDELSSRLRKAVRKAAIGRNLNDPHDIQKTMASLIRKGYTYREARHAVAEYLSE